MTKKYHAEVRRVSVRSENEVEIGFVFLDEDNEWRRVPGFDVLKDGRLRAFMMDHACEEPEDLKELAPPSKGAIGVEEPDDPVWVEVSNEGPGPDTWSINVKDVNV